MNEAFVRGDPNKMYPGCMQMRTSRTYKKEPAQETLAIKGHQGLAVGKPFVAPAGALRAAWCGWKPDCRRQTVCQHLGCVLNVQSVESRVGIFGAYSGVREPHLKWHWGLISRLGLQIQAGSWKTSSFLREQQFIYFLIIFGPLLTLLDFLYTPQISSHAGTPPKLNSVDRIGYTGSFSSLVIGQIMRISCRELSTSQLISSFMFLFPSDSHSPSPPFICEVYVHVIYMFVWTCVGCTTHMCVLCGH